MTAYCVLRLVIDRASPLLVSVSSSSLYRHSDPWTHRHSFQTKSIVSSRCLPGEDARSRRFTFWKISGSSRCHRLDRLGKIGKRPRHGNEELRRRARIRMLGSLHKSHTNRCQTITRRKVFDLFLPRISGLALHPIAVADCIVSRSTAAKSADKQAVSGLHREKQIVYDRSSR